MVTGGVGVGVGVGAGAGAAGSVATSLNLPLLTMSITSVPKPTKIEAPAWAVVFQPCTVMVSVAWEMVRYSGGSPPV